MDLQVLNPVANVKRAKVELASRLQGLSGKTIGLYWNGKPGGKILLEYTAELLKQRYSGITFRDYVGAGGAAMRQTTREQADAIANECDALIGATAD
jgi:hypothetical protein